MKHIILDIDSVGDDMLAVLYAAHHPDIDILGITTVNGACGSIEQANHVALKMVELTGKEIPVYSGAAEMLNPRKDSVDGDPVNFEEVLRPKLGERLDKFNEVMSPTARKVEEMKAEDFIIQMAYQYEKELVVVTTGPTTNLAKALCKDKTIAEKIGKVYMLGGNFQIAGNITPASEYNIWADPEAAQVILRSDLQVVLVPLDICENNEFADGMMTRDHLADLSVGAGPVCRFIMDKFPIYIDIWREFFQLAGFPMDDVITVALVAEEELCTYSEPVFVDIELNGDITRGMTVAYFGHQIVHNVRKEHRNVRIAQSVQGKKFMNLFVETLKGK